MHCCIVEYLHRNKQRDSKTPLESMISEGFCSGCGTRTHDLLGENSSVFSVPVMKDPSEEKQHQRGKEVLYQIDIKPLPRYESPRKPHLFGFSSDMIEIVIFLRHFNSRFIKRAGLIFRTSRSVYRSHTAA